MKRGGWLGVSWLLVPLRVGGGGGVYFNIVVKAHTCFGSRLTGSIHGRLLRALAGRNCSCIVLPRSTAPANDDDVRAERSNLGYTGLFHRGHSHVSKVVISLPGFNFRVNVVGTVDMTSLGIPILIRTYSSRGSGISLSDHHSTFYNGVSMYGGLCRCNVPFASAALRACSVCSSLLTTSVGGFTTVYQIIGNLHRTHVNTVNAHPTNFRAIHTDRGLLRTSNVAIIPMSLSRVLSTTHGVRSTSRALRTGLGRVERCTTIPRRCGSGLVLRTGFNITMRR